MIRSETEHLPTGAASHAGMRGKQNEDRFLVTHFWDGVKQDIPSVLAVLCDGIGGHRAGEVAAEIGVSTITESVAEGDPQRPLRTLEEAVRRANRAIYTASTAAGGRQGMGTTCACAWVIGRRLYTTNLGDSRIYLLRDSHIIQLTTDHTWIQEAIDAGILTDPAQNSHPNAHVIRRYLGSAKPPEPDFRLWFFEGEGDDEALANQGLHLLPGDMLLLCSDGLTDLVSDGEIQEVVQSLPLAQAPDRLISLANTRGGHDNTTVVLLCVPGNAQKTPPASKRNRLVLGCLGALVFLSILIALTLFGVRWWRESQAETPIPSPGATFTPEELLLPILEETPRPSPSWTSTPEETGDSPPALATLTPWPTHTRGP